MDARLWKMARVVYKARLCLPHRPSHISSVLNQTPSNGSHYDDRKVSRMETAQRRKLHKIPTSPPVTTSRISNPFKKLNWTKRSVLMPIMTSFVMWCLHGDFSAFSSSWSRCVRVMTLTQWPSWKTTGHQGRVHRAHRMAVPKGALYYVGTLVR